jgi:hypothetical protein
VVSPPLGAFAYIVTDSDGPPLSAFVHVNTHSDGPPQSATVTFCSDPSLTATAPRQPARQTSDVGRSDFRSVRPRRAAARARPRVPGVRACGLGAPVGAGCVLGASSERRFVPALAARVVGASRRHEEAIRAASSWRLTPGKRREQALATTTGSGASLDCDLLRFAVLFR